MDMSQFTELCILLGCDYLEPIKGVGPKSALKLLKEHGNLGNVVKHLRAKSASKKAAQEVAASSEDEEPPASEAEEPAATSDIEMPDHDVDEDEDEVKENPASEEKKKKAKATPAKVKGKAKGKSRGGVQIPDEWDWESAKKIFEEPDVLPADEVELEWKNPDVEGLVEFLVKEKGFNEERVRKGAEKLQKYLHTKQQGRLDGFFTVKPKEKAPPAKDNGKTGGKRKGGEKAESSSKKSRKK